MDCGEQTETAADLERDIPTRAQAETTLADSRTIVIVIAVGTLKQGLSGKPKVFHISVGQNGRFSTVKRLSEFKSVVEKGKTSPTRGGTTWNRESAWSTRVSPPPHTHIRPPRPEMGQGRLLPHTSAPGEAGALPGARPRRALLRPAAPEELATPKEWAKLHPGKWDGVVVTPLPKLRKTVVLTAWRKRLRLD